DSGSSGSGTVWIDKFELLRSTVIVIDDFQSSASNLNFLNGTSTQTFAGGGGTATTQYSALGADNVLELNYNVNAGGSFSGMFFGLRGRTFQGYTHLSFRIRGGAGGEKILAKLESPTGSTELGFTTTPYLTNGITTSFQTVTIPLSAFPNVNLSSVTAFTFVATQSTGSAAGQIFLDDIKFLRQGDSAGVLRVIDDMDMDLPSSNFEANSHANASLQTSVVSDATVPEAKSDNRVYKLEYTFRISGVGDTPWVVIERPLFHSIAPFSNLKFRYQGAGSANNVELKLTDSDNTTWYRKFLLASNTEGAWKTASLALDQLTFFSAGDDSNLNTRKIKQIFFAVAKGPGGSGSFAVDTLEASDSGEFETNSPSGVISKLKILNNPFSPNGDGTKDEVFFVYTLTVNSKVNLKIYGLDGVEIRMAAQQDQTSGEQTLSWNGRNDNSEIVPNGVYLFRLEAEGIDSRKDVLRQVIAVLR
ncbi:MAG: gliding motility-associated C-terminal domain-containing protein, partial [Elusimicrobia bacterium]|nr:gliding motility-associated C-terminal domain-containing protein [Elusimicrobiota bacterium]